MSRETSGKNGIKLLILAVIMIGLIVGYYYHLSNKTSQMVENNTTITATQEVLLRDMENNYPPSPKEVIKYYAEITKCFYDGGYSDEELVRLAKRSRELFDAELYGTQTDEEYLESLNVDIEDYKKKNMKISSYSTSSSIDVNYYKKDGREMASLFCLFNVRQASTMLAANQEFYLRKDDRGHWKILGWTAKEKDV